MTTVYQTLCKSMLLKLQTSFMRCVTIEPILFVSYEFQCELINILVHEFELLLYVSSLHNTAESRCIFRSSSAWQEQVRMAVFYQSLCKEIKIWKRPLFTSICIERIYFLNYEFGYKLTSFLVMSLSLSFSWRIYIKLQKVRSSAVIWNH